MRILAGTVYLFQRFPMCPYSNGILTNGQEARLCWVRPNTNFNKFKKHIQVHHDWAVIQYILSRSHSWFFLTPNLLDILVNCSVICSNIYTYISLYAVVGSRLTFVLELQSCQIRGRGLCMTRDYIIVLLKTRMRCVGNCSIGFVEFCLFSLF